VELERDAAALGGGRVVDVGGDVAVERDADARADGDDLVGVSSRPSSGTACRDRRRCRQDARGRSPRKLAHQPGPTSAWQPSHLEANGPPGPWRQRLGVELDAAVAGVVDELHFEREL
jgi:hypothetical protein